MKLLSLDQICEILDVDRHTVMTWVKGGLFPVPFRVGRRHLRWFESDVQKFLREQQRAAAKQQREAIDAEREKQHA